MGSIFPDDEPIERNLSIKDKLVAPQRVLPQIGISLAEDQDAVVEELSLEEESIGGVVVAATLDSIKGLSCCCQQSYRSVGVCLYYQF